MWHVADHMGNSHWQTIPIAMLISNKHVPRAHVLHHGLLAAAVWLHIMPCRPAAKAAGCMHFSSHPPHEFVRPGWSYERHAKRQVGCRVACLFKQL